MFSLFLYLFVIAAAANSALAADVACPDAHDYYKPDLEGVCVRMKTIEDVRKHFRFADIDEIAGFWP